MTLVPCDILIVGTSIDSHLEAVQDALPRHLSVARLDVDRFPVEVRLDVEFGADGPRVRYDDGALVWDISHPRAAWFRRLGSPGLHPELAERYRTFALGEVEHFLEGVLSLVTPRRWLNPYRETRAAANKLWQLELALDAGLEIPDTWIGNSEPNAHAWLDAQSRDVIAKSLHSPLIAGHKTDARAFSFTHVLSAEERNRLASVEVAPVQLQPFVEKAYELRVTSIGGRHFAARVDTDREGIDNADWRAGHHELGPATLPSDVGDKLGALLSRLGIQYAASDFIVTPAGEHVFLEANPHGAWLWIEQALSNYHVAAAIAAYLCKD